MKTAVDSANKKAMTFAQLLSHVKKQENAASLLQTARRTDWLTDGRFFIRLNEAEQEKIMELCGAMSDKDKKAKILDLNSLPNEVGHMADFRTSRSQVIVESSSGKGKSVSVDAILFASLQKRYPNATVYLSSDHKFVQFSDFETVALLKVA